MAESLYYKIILEELAWKTLYEQVERISYIRNGIKKYCPGDYNLVFDPKFVDKECLVDCGSFNLYLLFKNKYDRASWILKWS